MSSNIDLPGLRLASARPDSADAAGARRQGSDGDTLRPVTCPRPGSPAAGRKVGWWRARPYRSSSRLRRAKGWLPSIRPIFASSLHALAYNLANFMRTLALPEEVEHWSLTTLREKLVKIGARIVRHGRYVVFQLAEVAVSRPLFAGILRQIDDLRPLPPPLPA
jgi:Transposase DDE domain group 1